MPGENLLTCCCCGDCPSTCTECDDLVFTVTGGSGCCCEVVNVADEPLTRTLCTWTALYIDGATFAAARLEIECVAGMSEDPDCWKYTLTVISKPGNDDCDPDCNAEDPEVWEGLFCCVGPCALVTDLELDWVSGPTPPDCDSVTPLTLTVELA
jgi:hypothetical protein